MKDKIMGYCIEKIAVTHLFFRLNQVASHHRNAGNAQLLFHVKI